MHATALGSEFVIRFNKLEESIYYSIFVAYRDSHRLRPHHTNMQNKTTPLERFSA